MRERSNAYPIFDLAVAYRILRQDLADLGAGEFDRSTIFSRLGHTAEVSGGAARKVAALVQYGLLDYRGGLYGLSALGLRLQRLKLGDPEFRSATSACLECPTLFRAILERFRSEGRIPQDLAQHLSAFRIMTKASTEAAGVFWRSALFADVLTTDGRLTLSPDPNFAPAPRTKARATPTEEVRDIPMLLAKGRQGILRIPGNLSREDFLALEDSWRAVKRHLGFPASINTSSKERKQKAKPLLPFRMPKR
ncbi:MAG TPA: hypothetical protein VN851_06895 [Thermoanaerobaculia bacterium]|nr:hypothetical protein [Thermoanaerobaculia bacterium]